MRSRRLSCSFNETGTRSRPHTLPWGRWWGLLAHYFLTLSAKQMNIGGFGGQGPLIYKQIVSLTGTCNLLLPELAKYWGVRGARPPDN